MSIEDCVMKTKPAKVAIWCVPRTASTALAKCLCAVEDIDVYLEPYAYATSVSGLFSGKTGRNLPHGLDGNEAVYEEANALWAKDFGERLSPRSMSYITIKEDLENTSKHVFIKDMACRIDLFRPYLPHGFKHTFLIKEPLLTFVSYRKAGASMFSDLIPSDIKNFDIVRHDPIGIRPMTWFEKQHELWKYVKENLDPHPIIIDTCDLLSRPGPMLKAYCEAVGFPYKDDLLQWEASLEMPKNMVTAGAYVLQDAIAFYERSLNSTHFMAPEESDPISRDQQTDDVIRCCDHATPFYKDMFDQRLRA